MSGRRNFPGLVAAVVLTGLAFHLNFALIRVDGTSMMPNFRDGDLVLVWRGAYWIKPPARSEVVVARTRTDLIIKRVLGLPEETVEITQGKLWVNGQRARENYLLATGNVAVGRGTLGQGKYALFGDNRNVPRDQMIAAVVTQEQLLGKVVLAISWKSALEILRSGTQEESGT